jgi:hypothetical protein
MRQILRKDVNTGEMVNIAGHCQVKSIKIEWYGHMTRGDYREIEKMAKLYSMVRSKKYYYVYSARNNPVLMFEMKLLHEVFTDYIELLKKTLIKHNIPVHETRRGYKYANSKRTPKKP